MNPIKRKELFEETARKTGLSPELTEKIVNDFYVQVRKKLSAVEHTHVNVPGLGIFTAKINLVASAIIREKAYIENLKHPRSLTGYQTRDKKIIHLDKLEEVMKKILLNLKSKHEKRVERYVYIDAKEKDQ